MNNLTRHKVKNPFLIEDIEEFKKEFKQEIMDAVLTAHKDILKANDSIPSDEEIIEKMYIEDLHCLTHIVGQYHLKHGMESKYEKLKIEGPEIEDLEFFYYDIIDIRGALDYMKLTYKATTPLFGVFDIINPISAPFIKEENDD